MLPNELHDISLQISDIKLNLTAHLAVTREQDRKLDELYRYIVVGDNQPSLKSRVDRIEEMLPDHETWLNVKTWVANEKKVLWTLLTVIIAQVVILGFQFFK